MPDEIVHYERFSHLYEEHIRSSLLPDLLYLAPDALLIQQARSLVRNRFAPKMALWREFLHRESLALLEPGEALLGTDIERYMLRKVLAGMSEFNGIARFEGACRRFKEIFSLMTLNPGTRCTDAAVQRAYLRYQKEKRRARRPDSYDLLSRLAARRGGLCPGSNDLALEGFYWVTEVEWRCLAGLVGATKGKVFWVGDFFEEFADFLERGNPPASRIRSRIEQRYRATLAELRDAPPSSKQVCVLPDRLEEVRAIASRLKQWILEETDQGRTPDLSRCMVFFYDIQTYVPLVRRIFREFDIPFHAPEPPALSSLPLWGFLKRLLDLPRGPLRFEDLMSLVESGFLPTTVDTSAAGGESGGGWGAFAKAMCERYSIELPETLCPAEQEIDLTVLARVAAEVSAVSLDLFDPEERFLDRSVRFLLGEIDTAYHDRHKQRVKEQLHAFLRQYYLLRGLMKTLEPFIEAQDPSEKIEALLGLLQNLIFVGPEEERSRRALEHAVLALIELKHALAVLGRGQGGAAGGEGLIAETLAAALSSQSEPQPPRGNEVLVTGSLATAGLDIERIYIGGLVEGEFPPRRLRAFKWELASALEPIDNIVQSHYLVTRFVDRIPHIEFFFPRADRDGPLKKSPFLIDAGFVETKGASASPAPAGPAPQGAYLLDEGTLYREAGRALRTAGAEGNPAALAILPAYKDDPKRLENVVAMQASRSDPGRFSAYEGIIGPCPCFRGVLRQRVSVTALEDLAACPMRYHFKEHLRLERLELPAPGLRATRAGSLLHKILERFFSERDYEPVRPEGLSEAAALLWRIADEEFRHVAGHHEYSSYLEVDRETLVSGLADNGPQGILRAWLEQEAVHGSLFSPARDIAGAPGIEFTYPRPGERFTVGGFELAGRIDRIDVHSNGDFYAVFDYKKGDAPAPALMEAGLNLQLPTYAYYVERTTGKRLLLGGYIPFKGAPTYSIQLLSLKEEDIGSNRLLPRAMLEHYGIIKKSHKSRTSLRQDGERACRAYEDLLGHRGIERLFADLREAYEQGRFHYTLKDPEIVCRYCEYDRICRKDLEKAERVRATSGGRHEPAFAGLSEVPRPEPPPPSAVAASASPAQGLAMTPSQEAALDLARNIVVTAGAGSGKTQALVERAIKIFRSGVPVDRVLVITFTQKAAREMRDRIYTRLVGETAKRPAAEVAPGLRAAYQAFVDNYISTIDSFCMGVLREFADQARVNPDLELAHDFLLKQLREEALDRHLDALAQQGDERVRLLLHKWPHRRLKELVAGLVEEDRVEQWAARISSAEECLRELCGSGAPQAGQQSAPEAHSEAESVLRWYRAFADLVLECRRRYLDLKDRHGFYTFADLKRKVLELLESSPAALTALRSRFRYIMVDEFQDTDEVQWRILELLGAEEQGGRLAGDKIFLVGDEKQSIFRFRGADLPVFKQARAELLQANQRAGTCAAPLVLEHNRHYLPSERERAGDIRFNQNFRSDGALVAFFNDFFGWLFTEADPGPFHAAPEPMSVAGNKEGRGAVDLHIVLQEAPGGAEQAEFELAACLARDLAAEWKGHPTALLIRSRTALEHLERALQKAGVHYRVHSGIGYYQSSEVKDLWLALACITNPHDDMNLVGLLRSPLMGLSDVDIWRIAASRADPGQSLFSAMRGLEEYGPAYAMLDRWVRLKKERILEELLELVVQESGYVLPSLCAPGWEQRLANIEKLFDIASAFSRVSPSLESFVGYLDVLIRTEVREQDNPVHVEEDAPVHVMTIHAAKGLQFSTVILADAFRAVRADAEPHLVRMDDGRIRVAFKVPLEIPGQEEIEPEYFKAAKKCVDRQIEAETKRLLYVALTRAIHNVIIVGSERPGRGGHSSPFRKWLYEFLELPDKLDASMAGRRNVKGVRIMIHGPGSRFLEEDAGRLQVPSWEAIKAIADNAPPITVRRVEAARTTTLTPSKKEHASAIAPDIVLEKAFIPFGNAVRPREPWRDHPLAATLSRRMGEIVHQALARMQWDERSMRAAVSSLAGQLLSPDLLDAATAALLEHVGNVRRSALWGLIEQARQRYHELDFSLYRDGRLITGTIDLLCRFEEGWRIYDWKTVTALSEGEAAQIVREHGYDEQVKAYYWAVSELAGEEPLSASIVLTGWGVCEMTRQPAARAPALQCL